MTYRLQAYDQQIIRFPALSRQDISNRLSHRKASEVFFDADVANYFRLSKPLLYDQLVRKISSGDSSPALQETILKYLVRMCSRPVPNRCFAGVGITGTGPEVKSVINLPLLPKTSKYFSLNQTLTFRKNACGFYSYDGKSVEPFKQYGLHTQLIQILRSLPDQFEIAAFKRALGSKTKKEASLMLERLIDIGVVVRVKSHPSFESAKASHVGNESVLKSSFPEAHLPKRSAETALSIGRDLLEMRFSWRLHYAQQTLWSVTRKLLDQHFDHGPVPFLDVSEKAIHFMETVSYKTEASQFEEFLFDRAQELSITGGSWIISDEDWDKLKNLTHHKPLHLVSLSTLIFTDRELSFKHLSGAMSNSATKIFGRFGDFDPAISEFIKEIQTHEISASSESLSEIEFPMSELTETLMQRHSFLKNCITLNPVNARGVERLRPSDLFFLKDRSGNWVLKSLPSGDTILPCFTHLMNPNFIESFHYRLLEDYAQSRTPQSYIWNWGKARDLIFLPRVERAGYILAFAKWRLFPFQNQDISAVEFIQRISPPLPEYLFLVEDDKRLPFRRSDPTFLSLLETRMKKGLSTNLEEDPSGGRDLLEVVVVGRNPQREEIKHKKGLPLELSSTGFKNFRLFLDPTRTQEFFQFFKKNLRRNGKSHFDPFSFIIYHRPKYHIRLRVLEKESNSSTYSLLQRALNEGLLFSYSAHHYSPELDRWQGAIGLRLYEQLSCVDSELKLRKSDFNTEDTVSAALSWLAFMFPKSDDQVRILKSLISQMPSSSTTHIGASIKILPKEVIHPFPLSKSSHALEIRTRKFLATLTPEKRLDWVGGILHLSFNRFGFIREPSEEKAIYQRALGWVMANT